MPRLSAPPRGAALRHLAPPPTRTRAPSPALATRLHGAERILRALVPCLEPTVYLMQSFPTSLCLQLRARRPHARARAPPLLRSNTLNFMAPKFGSERSGVGPEFENGDGRLRPGRQQRLPGAEGPPEGCTTAPRHAACGGPLPSYNECGFDFLPATPSQESLRRLPWCTCVSASARQSRAQCCARD